MRGEQQQRAALHRAYVKAKNTHGLFGQKAPRTCAVAPEMFRLMTHEIAASTRTRTRKATMLELLIEKMSCPTPAMAETCCRTAGRAQVPQHHVRVAERRGRRRAASFIVDAGTPMHIHERAMFFFSLSSHAERRLDVPWRAQAGSRMDRYLSRDEAERWATK